MKENYMADKPDLLIELLNGIDFKLSLILWKMINAKDGDVVIKDEIKVLYKVGADSKTIAQILGIPTEHASQEISRHKKNQKQGRKTDDQKRLKTSRKNIAR
jgi:hypothetical protein